MCNIDEELKDLSKRQYTYEKALIKEIDEKQEKIKQLQEEIERLNNIIDEIRKIVKHEKEELDKFKGVDLLINTYQQVFGVMLEMLELKEGKENDK